MSIAKEDKLVRGGDLTTVASSLKTYIQNQVNHKFGSVYFDTETNSLLFFKNDTDKDSYIADSTQSELIVDSIVVSASSNIQYRVVLYNRNQVSGQNNTIQIATNATELNLMVDFDVQMSSDLGQTYISTGRSARFKVYTYDANNIKTEVVNAQTLCFGGQQFVFNIRPYLSVGTTRVEVEATMDGGTDSGFFIYQIIVSEMYIEESNNNWYNAIVENGLYDANYKLGGFKIVGSMSKTLHIDLYQANTLVKSFEKVLGQNSYNDESPYYFTHLEGFDMQSDNSNLTTGIYMVRAYLTSDNLTSLPVVYNIMYVDSYSINTAQLVCTNNTATIAYNYSSLILCDYAIYNKGLSVGDPHLLLQYITGNTPSTKENKDLENTATGTLHHLNDTVEWLTEDVSGLYIHGVLTLGSSSQLLDIPIDNSATYPAETGSVFYLNASTRNNTDINKTKIVNEATLPSTELTPTWTKMSWVDGIDGWTVDDAGRKCLLIPAKSLMSLPYQILTGENITIELCYKVANVVDYDENVITIASNPTTAGFQGIRIKPTNVTVHSSADMDASRDTKRGTNLSDETVQHLMITIANAYSGNDKNLVTGYVNGSVGFQFEYGTDAIWANNVPLIIGSQYSDVYIYFIRVYNSLLGKSGIEKNYINSLTTRLDRGNTYDQFYNIVKQSTREITYENVSKSNKNFFVVEMLNDATIPSRANGWTKDSKGKSNFEMHFGEHPLWDFKLYNVETAGQGTTSMDYYRWNIRFRIDKSNDNKTIPISYYDTPSVALDGSKTYNEQESTTTNSVYFDGGANNTAQQHPKVKRITAKINFASSMQSHKIGATRAYDALRNQLGLENAAQYFASHQSPQLPKPTVAVYQYPAYGFSKTVSPLGAVRYEYIGLFTIGPDKGDKPTFGYDIDNSIKNYLITMEGTDHSRRMAKFLYPWNANVEYRDSNECLNIVVGNGFDNGWEISNCYGYDIGNKNAVDQTAINTKLVAEFKPAYDVVYNNSTQIFPIALGTYGATAAATVTAINADIENFKLTSYDSRLTYADMEFWIEGEYVLYYYDIVQNKYVAGVNLVTDLNQGQPVGSTLAEKNEWFKQKRRDRFKANAENYWDIQDAIYHFLFVLWFGATDNFAKNTYPYKMGNLSGTGRWCWRQDDLDTIFDIDNLGGQTKPYYIEYRDANNGSPYFAGSTSVFWNLLFETYWEDYGLNKGIASTGKLFIDAMKTLGSGSNTFAGCKNFINTYFWNNAQNYFNQSVYNIDAVYKYETAWLNNGQSVDPLSQSLGNHYSAEQLWVDRRIIYMMSLFKAGPFGTYDDATLGRISFRPKTISSFNVTPLINIYPAIIEGAGSPEETSRTTAGTVKEFTGIGDSEGNTTFYIQATNYLTSLGDWKDIKLGTGSGEVGTIAVNSKKLKEFNIGDATASNVTTNIPSISFPNNKCLETINARNASSLTGAIELLNCTRLTFADFRGTNITHITLPVGSKIEHLYYPDSTQAINLRNLNFLQDLILPSDLSNINTIRVENCTYQDAFDILRDVYDTDNSSLQYIRVVWNSPITGTVDDMSMLANIRNNLDKNGNAVTNNYGGIANNGSATLSPVIEGTIQLTTGLYTSDLEVLGTSGEPEVIDGTIVRSQTSAFGTLYIIYDSARVYIQFADTAVETICKNNWSSDNIGVTMNDAATPTSFGTLFRQNTNITSFNEMQYFTNVKVLGNINNNQGGVAPFYQCSNLTSVDLKNVTQLGESCFGDCGNLTSLGTTTNITHIGRWALSGTNLPIEIDLPNLVQLRNGAFGGTNITKVKNLGSIPDFSENYNNGGVFRNCTSLTSVVLPQTCKTINDFTFYGCSSLTTINLNYVEYLGKEVFNGCTSLEFNPLSLPSLKGFSSAKYVFNDVKIYSVSNLGTITSLPDGYEKGGIFRGKSELTSVTLPNTLVTLGGTHFEYCTGLTSFTIPESVTYIGYRAFRGCSNLETVNLSSNASVSLGEGVFADCTKLSTITNGNAVVSIGVDCFNNSGLPDINFPNITSVGTRAFRLSKVATITSLASVQTFGTEAFANTSKLTTLNSSAFPNLTSIGSNCFNQGALTSVNLLSLQGNALVINNDAFRNMNNLNIVKLPTDVVLGGFAFADTGGQNYNATTAGQIDFSLDLSQTAMTTLQACIFYRSKLQHIVSLGSITTIAAANNSRGVFELSTYLLDAVLPSTLTSIGTRAFRSCYSLTTVTCLATTPPTLSDDIFSDSSALIHIYVPAASVDAYKAASYWSSRASIIEAIPSA